ncbi:lipase 1-like [Coccinella septempunctata]|uniref:lipase 1-like n=1 Tax=Coccinella septempunctata TaxID=41139 RepID=UPI001D094C79|nr:lipase 1-like [Coccinella septempunctata]
MHGLLGHSDQFLFNNHENGSLALYLANEGFDVWLGNTRGSISGERHVQLDRSSHSFWNFSNHEMGVYDLPALVDYILEKTGNKNLQYVGYSQGVRIFLIMASMRPEYQQKISLASVIGPSGFLENLDSWWLKPLGLWTQPILRFCTYINIHVLPPELLNMGHTTVFFCQNILTSELCFKIYKSMVGDSGEITSDSLSLLAKYTYHVPTKQLSHYGQTIVSGHFRPWDYGPSGNVEAYGQETPPDYDIENVTVPLAVYYSLGDAFANYKVEIYWIWHRKNKFIQKIQILPKYTGKLWGYFYK